MNETSDFIKAHLHDDIAKLLFQKERYPNIDINFAITQIEGRRKAALKIPTLIQNENFLYPVGVSVEQCSSEYAARYKASLLKQKTVADITGGFGIDTFFISEQAKEVTYIEQNIDLFNIAVHNFRLFEKKNIQTICADGLLFLEENPVRYDIIYADPSRRGNHNQKCVLLSDCSPDILSCKELLFSKADMILIKTSPMLDISKTIKDLSCVKEVHVVAVDNECKELLFVCKPELVQDISITCINLFSLNNKQQEFTFSANQEAETVINYTSFLQCYLYEPNSAILKAGAFKTIAKQFNISKLHTHSHLYTSNTLIENFPGKVFQIKEYFSLNEKNLKTHLPNKKANIVVRNFPLTVQQICKKYKLTEGGSEFLFATTLQTSEKIVILCEKC